MKTNFSYQKVIVLLLVFTITTISGTVLAQTTHNVAVSDFKFEPANLSIAVGDIVKWTNNQGTHSVDGTTATFPNNPASFGNSSGGPGWTYSFTFSTAGVYNYECGVHGSAMSGKITVGNATGINDVSQTASDFKAFPNPNDGILNITVPESFSMSNASLVLKIYDINGAVVNEKSISEEKPVQINITNLSTGFYIYELSSKNKIISSGKFIKS